MFILHANSERVPHSKPPCTLTIADLHHSLTATSHTRPRAHFPSTLIGGKAGAGPSLGFRVCSGTDGGGERMQDGWMESLRGFLRGIE